MPQPDLLGSVDQVLEVDRLVRTYGPVRALDGMTFTVEPGSVTGFLGPNGAGKTTTMRAIFGLVALDAGGGASLLLWILAFFPPTAVLAMPTLYAVGEAPLWAVFVSMALTAVAVVVVALVSAKIYERSVLRTGKKLSWRAAIRLRDEIGHVDTLRTTA